MSSRAKAPRRPGIHKSPTPVSPNKPTTKVVPTLFLQPYSVSTGHHSHDTRMDYAIVPDGIVTPGTKAVPVAFTVSDELAFKIARLLSAEYKRENPDCAGCAAFGPPVWEGELEGRTGNLGTSEGWYHFTGGIHPFKEKYIWCARMNKPAEISEEDLRDHTTLDDEVLDTQTGTLDQLADSVGRHYAAMHEFPRGDYRKKFIEEVREIQEDIRGWKIAPSETVQLASIYKDVAKTLNPVKADVKEMPISMNKEQVEFQLKCVAGRVLTLVDAMVSNETQNKAFKTYIKKEFREQFSRVFNAFHPSYQGCESSEPEELAVANKEF